MNSQLTSEPSLSRPDCSQSSCDDSDDRDTLEAPKLAEMSWSSKPSCHRKSTAYQGSACACQLVVLAYPERAVRVEANETPQNMPAEQSIILSHIKENMFLPDEESHRVQANHWHPLSGVSVGENHLGDIKSRTLFTINWFFGDSACRNPEIGHSGSPINL